MQSKDTLRLCNYIWTLLVELLVSWHDVALIYYWSPSLFWSWAPVYDCNELLLPYSNVRHLHWVLREIVCRWRWQCIAGHEIFFFLRGRKLMYWSHHLLQRFDHTKLIQQLLAPDCEASLAKLWAVSLSVLSIFTTEHLGRRSLSFEMPLATEHLGRRSLSFEMPL
jgi:hypothetical protein